MLLINKELPKKNPITDRGCEALSEGPVSQYLLKIA